MFELLEFLERKKLEVEASWIPGDETGANLSYDLINDTSIELLYGWNSYEEGDDNEVLIFFPDSLFPDIDKIMVERTNSGHSCMGGDYDNRERLEFDTESELIEWLNEEF